MCLFTRKLKFRTARKDKVFYKVLVRRNDKITTPFWGDEVEFNKILYPIERIPTRFLFNGIYYKIKSKFNVLPYTDIKNTDMRYHRSLKAFVIEGGVIHLYATKKDALLGCTVFPHSFVVKAIIPKGTKYIKSFDNCEIGTLGVIYKEL